MLCMGYANLRPSFSDVEIIKNSNYLNRYKF